MYGEENKIFSDKLTLITENARIWPVSRQILIVKVCEKNFIEEMSSFFKQIFSFKKIAGMPIKIKCNVDFCGTWASAYDREDLVVRFPSKPTSFLKNEIIFDNQNASKFIEKWEQYDYGDIIEFWIEEHTSIINQSVASHFMPSRIISVHVYLQVMNMLETANE